MTDSLRKALDTIIQVADPDKVILFGSHAKGINTKESDYDLLVLKNSIKKRRELSKKLYKSFNSIGAPIDIIVNELHEYEELKTNPYLIYHTISEEGIVIYEKR